MLFVKPVTSLTEKRYILFFLTENKYQIAFFVLMCYPLAISVKVSFPRSRIQNLSLNYACFFFLQKKKKTQNTKLDLISLQEN